jgi:hypothetical protein
MTMLKPGWNTVFFATMQQKMTIWGESCLSSWTRHDLGKKKAQSMLIAPSST